MCIMCIINMCSNNINININNIIIINNINNIKLIVMTNNDIISNIID